MPQLDAKLSIVPAFERTLAALRELGGLLDQVNSKASKGAGGAAGGGALGATGKGAAEATVKVKELGEEVKKTDAAAKRTSSSPALFTQIKNGARSVSEQLAAARAQLLAFVGLQAGLQGAQQLAALSDRYAGMTARLRIATRDQAEYNAALATAGSLARQYNQPLAETSTLLTRMLSAVRPLGGGLREANIATEGVAAALRISGASATESSSAILQFSQALGSGALRGEEFNAIAEAAPRLLDALAAGLGRSRGELKGLAEQGALTTDAVIRAINQQLPQLRREAAQIPATIGSAVQNLNNQFFQLVGSSAEGSTAVRVVVNALDLLAQNIDKVVLALVAMGVAFVALKLGSWAAGFTAIATTAVAAGAAAGSVAVGFRALLALLGGPVGIIVSLTAAAAAWLALGKAKEKAKERTAKDAEAELTDAEAELLKVEAKLADRNKPLGFNYRGIEEERAQIQKRINALREELAAKKDIEYHDQERQRMDSRAPAPSLTSPKVIEDFRKDNEDRAAIVERYEKRRVEFVSAAERQIAQLRRLGATDEAIAEEKKRNDAALAVQRRKLQDELAGIDRRDATTRIAQARATFNTSIELLRDQLQREAALNQAAYDDKLVDLQAYLSERERIERSDLAARISRIQQELAAERDALDKNQARLGSAKAGNDREGLQDAVARGNARVAELEAEIEKAVRDGNTQLEERLRLVRQIAKELGQQRQQIQFALEDAGGQDLDREALRRRAEAANRAVLEAFRQAGDKEGEGLTLKLIDVQTTQAELAQVQRAFERVQRDLSTQESGLQNEAAANAITAEEAERRTLELRRQQLPVLDALLERMEALAQTPEDRARIAALRVQIAAMRDLRLETEKTLRGSAVDGLANMIGSLVTGAKTLGQALRDAVLGFAQAMLQVLQRRLAEQLVNQFDEVFKASQGGGFFANAASFIASLFHRGGVVGQGGQRASVPLAAFALAPRYHSGGIAGLRPREVPAVLEMGEEVLTTDDPRHVKNGGRGGGPVVGNVNISVSVDSASSDAGSGQISAVLGRVLSAKVAEAIQEQMRPGGVLAR